MNLQREAGKHAGGHGVKSKRTALSRVWARPSLYAFVVVVALCSISAIGCGDPEDGPDPTTGVSDVTNEGGIEVFGISIDKVFCDIISTPPVEDAAKRVIRRASGNQIPEGFLLDTLIASVSYFCEPIVKKAVLVGREILGLQSKPVTSTSDTTIFEENIDSSATAADIAAQLSLDGGSIQNLSALVCDDLWGRRNANAGEDINSTLESPTLVDLRALNQFIGFTLDTCSPELTGFQMQTLTTTVINLLTSNTYVERDLSPPIVLIRRVDVDNFGRASVYWFGLDLGSGIAGYSLWASSGRGFYEIRLQSPLQDGAVYPLAAGYTYQFAVGAVDQAGNRSGWSYSDPVTAP